MLRYYEIKIPSKEAADWSAVDEFVGGVFAAVTGLGWIVQLNPWPNDSDRLICTVEALPHNDDVARTSRLFFPKVFARHRRILRHEMMEVAPQLLVDESA